MSSITNIFHSHLKDYPQTPDQFPQYKLEFLHSHEPSYKELGDVLLTKDQDKSDQDSFNDLPDFTNQQNQDLFELELEIKLRRYTSFQNGFMENHRKVLVCSLEQFLIKTSNFSRLSQGDCFKGQTHPDIKALLFDENLFTSEEIVQNKDRFRKKVDQFKILKEMFEHLKNLQGSISKDALMLGLWIMKHTDHIVQSILHENSFCIEEVKMLKSQIVDYLAKNSHIVLLKEKIAQERGALQEFNIMIESWLYTLLIAKLGYFQNDSFDQKVSLEEHLKALLRQEKRQHSVFSDSDSQEDNILSLELLTKKRKM